MLSRLCNSSLKLVAFKQIANHAHGHLASSSLVLSQKSNYATTGVENITETETSLAKEKTTSNNNDYAKTIENYTGAGNLKDALNLLKEASTNNESFKLDCKKVAEFVKLMLEKNHPFEEIEAILSAHSPSKPASHFPLFENLMSRLAINGQVELLINLFDALVKYNYIEANNESAKHLIKNSLHNGAYAQAVDLYEYMDETYQLTALTRALIIQFIQRREDDLLQRVYSIYEHRRGTQNALCLLGFAFIQCGNDQQAKANFQKVDSFGNFVIIECHRYVKFSQLQYAKNLLTATKGLNCHREAIYEAILDIYIKQNKAQESLNLWHEYTNDDIPPTQRFITKLVTFLNANSIKIPLDLDSNNDKKKRFNYATTSKGKVIDTDTLLAKVFSNNSGYGKKIENDTTAGNLENTLDMTKQVKNSSFKLDCNKVAELLESMVEGSYPFEEVETFLSTHSPSKPESHFSLFENIMSRLAINAEVQLLIELYDALIKYNYIEATIESSGYLVNGLLKNGAYVQALDMFEHIAKTYQLVPMSFVLFTQLIQHNEDHLLKRLFALYEQRCGTRNAFAKLAHAYVDCGNDRQAKTIFEKEGVSWKEIISNCQRYVEFENLQKARTLLTATKGLNCNRDVIYNAILEICIKRNKAQDALILWREYTNDETLQSQKFKTKLTTLLKTNHIEIPLDLNNEKDS